MNGFPDLISSVPTHMLLITVLFLITIAAFLWYMERKRIFSLMNSYGIPHPKPHILYGNVHQLQGKKLATEVMGEWHEKYGDVYGYFVGVKPYIVVKDLDMIKRILIKDFHNFVNRPKLMLKAEPVMKTLVGLRDQRWKEVRSVLTPTFSAAKMKHMSHTMNKAVTILTELMEEHSLKGEPVDVYAMFQGLTCDVIGQCALAMKVDCQRNKDDPFLNAVRNFLINAVNPAVKLATFFPSFAHCMSYVSNKVAFSGQMTQMIIKNVKEVIEIRRRKGVKKERHWDVLQLMLEAAENTTDSGTTEQGAETGGLINGEVEHSTSLSKSPRKRCLLTDAEIVANAWVFLLGGFETTANALAYTAYLLAKHQDVQEKVYQELQECLTEDTEVPTYDQIHSLSYLDQVFCESLRLYPPVVTFITRETASNITLGSWVIPAGVNIQIPVWQIHHDPELWPDPFHFDPDRFEADRRKSYHPMSWIPFGAGPRNCVGMRFAQLEAKLALARIIKNFRLEICAETDDPPKLVIPTVAINPKDGIYLRAVRRD